MNKVWLVFGAVDYEGYEVLGVFSSRDKAMVFTAEETERNRNRLTIGHYDKIGWKEYMVDAETESAPIKWTEQTGG